MSNIIHHHSTKPGGIETLSPDNTLYVISVISNPVRYNSRLTLFKKFQQHIRSFQGVKLITVEAAFGHRTFEVTTADNPLDVQVRMEHELWVKENLINIGISRLPHSYRYCAWVDGDIEFTNKDWASETVHQLQHYSIVQMWQNAIDLGPTGQTLDVHTSFGYQLANGTLSYLSTVPTNADKILPATPDESAYYSAPASSAIGPSKGAYAHSGFAHAARREAINAMGLLPEFCIVGSADHHACLSWIGKAHLSVPGSVTDSYTKAIMAYQDRCVKHIKSNVGYVSGTILHGFHGRKKDRRYVDRWKIIVDNQFDPYVDIWKDSQGLYQLNPDKPKLRDDLRRYFLSRNEDSIDL